MLDSAPLIFAESETKRKIGDSFRFEAKKIYKRNRRTLVLERLLFFLERVLLTLTAEECPIPELL